MGPTDMRNIVKCIVTHLVRKEYAAAEAMTCGVRLTASDLRSVIEDYGRTLIMPPKESLDDIDVRQVQGAHPPCFSVWCSLWTAEEGRSDLTLELVIAESKDSYRIEIADLHVQ